ncbi:hypothetical protein [Burkholderia contaminans]|uniref:hypothetical protein n=3 Tax=Burkholderia contaminans TaxID=488447 RepID=UPI001582FBF7|nr:hypothetical protein [Burkholderia contaminans]MCA8150845.1 hypothetical protein [Burkholderia contaminans]
MTEGMLTGVNAIVIGETEMDVREMLLSTSLKSGDRIEISGWLVDTDDGLYVLGDHSPESYEFPIRVKISNGNIMYPILDSIPSLGGGWSLLFYRVRLEGCFVSGSPCCVVVEDLKIEVDRDSGVYVNVDVNDDLVLLYVDQRGDYVFRRPRNPSRDWLDD